MTSPWMLREFERAARRPGIYWARGLAATNLIFLVFFFSSLPRESRFWSFWMSVLFLGNAAGTFMTASRTLKTRSLIAERNEGTLGLLITTRLRPVEIVLAKMLAVCAAWVYPALALTPLVAGLAWFGEIPLAFGLAWFAWGLSLLVWTSGLWVALTCTRTDEKNARTGAPLLIFLFLVGTGMLSSILAWKFDSSWSLLPALFNPFLALRLDTRAMPFVWSAVFFNLLWSALCVGFAVWRLPREVYPVRSKVAHAIYRVRKKLRDHVPGRLFVERRLLQRYPVAWLNVRSQAWIAMPICVGLISAWFGVRAVREKEFELLLFMTCLMVVFVTILNAVGMDQSLRKEGAVRLNELLPLLPIPPRDIVTNWLVERAFWIAPSFLLMTLILVTGAGVCSEWRIIPGILLELPEVLLLNAVICMGTYFSLMSSRSFFSKAQWGLAGLTALWTILLGVSVWFHVGGPALPLEIKWPLTTLVRIAGNLVAAWILFRQLEKRLLDFRDE
ncbi:MAG: hypothetical protein HY360_10770 [Verrucomicrobia bacterium]|nr:hypothetical protein [Verrucomicrobiota bacterium]